jgi:hypothetical protein
MYTQQIHAAGNQNELFNGSEARVHTQNRWGRRPLAQEQHS